MALLNERSSNAQTHQILSPTPILLLQVFINETFVNSITSSRCLKMSSEINESSSDELIDIGKILSEQQMPLHLVSLSQNLTASQLPPSTALIITCAARGCCIGRSLYWSVAFCRLLWVVCYGSVAVFVVDRSLCVGCCGFVAAGVPQLIVPLHHWSAVGQLLWVDCCVGWLLYWLVALCLALWVGRCIGRLRGSVAVGLVAVSVCGALGRLLRCGSVALCRPLWVGH